MESKRFKASMIDIGLMQHLFGIDPSTANTEKDLLGIYNGQLAEQLVAQKILAWHKENIYYWSRTVRNANVEVDFTAITY